MKKILIIEDNDDIRENTSEILSLAGYDTHTAPNGKAGIEAALQFLPDLIICDIMMPGLDGYGVLHIAQQRNELMHIPFVFLTAKSEKEDVRTGMMLGADDYITKPFEERDLLKVIEVRLKKHSQQQVAIQQPISRAADLLDLKAFEPTLRWYKKGEMIYHEGDAPQYFYKIKKGGVRRLSYNSDGKEMTLELVGKDEFFGLIQLFTDSPRKDSVEALEESEVCVYPKAHFKAWIEKDTPKAFAFFQALLEELSTKERRLMHIAFDTVRKRVASALLLYYHKFKDIQTQQGLHIPREIIATMAATSTESTIRVISEFKSNKWMEINGSYIKFLNISELEKVV